ncbi:uncharacterized protein LOC143184465 [Calliopsis andreniformis]|uniref:uncharacterized protein LOC143184465 n=1 Tax=Calliopsis andreniformis TaxID=337506 RepID=UPI003FCCC10D
MRDKYCRKIPRYRDDFEFPKIYVYVLNMDNGVKNDLDEKRGISTTQKDVKKEESSNILICKKNVKKSVFPNEVFESKDLLIAQLQEQVAKQRECISYYESIVQLMNYRLMKLKKVLKAHHLLDELD